MLVILATDDSAHLFRPVVGEFSEVAAPPPSWLLGFIGTVLGLSLAIGRFTATLQAAGDLTLIRASLQGVTGGLATAFESTLVALTFTLILQLVITFQQKREMAFLDECNDYCHSHIVSKLRLVNRQQAPAAATTSEAKS